MSISLKSEMNLQELRQKLIPSLDSIDKEGYDGIAIHSSGIVICADTEGARMFGYDQDNIHGVNAFSHYTPDSLKTVRHAVTNKLSDPYSVIAVTKDGEPFKVEIKGKDFELDGFPIRAVLLKKLD